MKLPVQLFSFPQCRTSMHLAKEVSFSHYFLLTNSGFEDYCQSNFTFLPVNMNTWFSLTSVPDI